MRAAAPGVPILIHANAGAPVVENGKTVFQETPEYMASRVAELVHAGANIIGGCCGTNPQHIAAIAAAVRALAAQSVRARAPAAHRRGPRSLTCPGTLSCR